MYIYVAFGPGVHHITSYLNVVFMSLFHRIKRHYSYMTSEQTDNLSLARGLRATHQ